MVNRWENIRTDQSGLNRILGFYLNAKERDGNNVFNIERLQYNEGDHSYTLTIDTVCLDSDFTKGLDKLVKEVQLEQIAHS